nr:MAG TPA_asm: hypothetical protein [Caudoviricetes sp.]
MLKMGGKFLPFLPFKTFGRNSQQASPLAFRVFSYLLPFQDRYIYN